MFGLPTTIPSFPKKLEVQKIVLVEDGMEWWRGSEWVASSEQMLTC